MHAMGPEVLRLLGHAVQSRLVCADLFQVCTSSSEVLSRGRTLAETAARAAVAKWKVVPMCVGTYISLFGRR